MFMIFISDIWTNSDAISYIYVDDSKVAMNVSNEEQVNNFQEELNIFYSWAKRNKMKFNEGKFVTLRYEKDCDLKDDTVYFTDNINFSIDVWEPYMDLAITMSSDTSFGVHIENTIKNIRKKIGFIDSSKIDVSYSWDIYLYN